MNAAQTDTEMPQPVARMLKTVAETINAYRMIEKADRVLVGVSGGPDSLALLHVLVGLSERYDLKLAVAHLNHGLRPYQALHDANRVASIAEHLGLPFFSKAHDVEQYRRNHRLSLEEAARQVRYAFLEQTAFEHGYNRIAVGHQADDNAELVLMFLMRGSGISGLAGIPPVRDHTVIRPLIRVTRRQILKYLAALNQPYLTDQTNQDTRLTRNRIRYVLIPRLRRDFNPGIVRTLNRLADIMRTDQEWIESVIDTVYKRVCVSQDAELIEMKIPRILKEHIAVQRRVLRKAVSEVKGDTRRISYRHIQDGLRVLGSGAASASIDWPDGIRLQKRGSTLIIRKEKTPLRERPVDPPAARIPYVYQIVEPITDPVDLVVKELGARFRFEVIEPETVPDIRNAGLWVAFFDMDAVKYPITLRNFQPGDRFVPLGMTGSQKLKKFFIDHKIERRRRSAWPIVLGADEIIWVVGCRISDRAKLRSTTDRVLKVACDLPHR